MCEITVTGIQSAIREQQHAEEIERNLIIARMLSHRMDASIRRCLLACDGLAGVVPPDSPASANLRLLRNRTVGTQVLIEHLLGMQKTCEATFDRVDLVQLLDDVRHDADLDIRDWKRLVYDRSGWECTLVFERPTEPLAIRGARHFLMNAFDNLLSNAIRAMAEKKVSGRITVVARQAQGDCVITTASEGPPLEPVDHFDYISRICASSGDLKDLITIQPSSSRALEPSSGHQRVGLKIAAWIVKGIHQGSMMITSRRDAAPSFEIRFPLMPVNTSAAEVTRP